MKVMIFLCAWKRPEITKLCYNGIHRIVDRFKKNGVEADVFVTVSEDYHADLAEEYGFKWVMSPNNPVGQKHHNGLMEALKYDWDYIMQMGSDDLISDHYIDVCCEHLGKHVIFGSDWYYFYNIDTKQAAKVKMKGGAPGGAGRFLKRTAIEKTLDRLGFIWQRQKNRRLDGSSWKSLTYSVWKGSNMLWKDFCYLIPFEEPVLVDIKSGDSMNTWEDMLGAGFAFSDFDSEIPLEEYPELKGVI